MLGNVLFAKLLRCEHREILDTLVEIGFVLGRNDLQTLRSLVGKLTALAGPHLRYEEEAFYPALLPILGHEKVEALLADHDQIIEAICELDNLRAAQSLSDEQARQALRRAQSLVRLMVCCDRLAALIGQISEDQATQIIDARDRALNEDLNLLHWSAWMRTRPACQGT